MNVSVSLVSKDQVPSNDYEEEYLWSCEFSGASKEYSWCPEDPADQDDEDPSVKPGRQMLLNSAVLMPSAKAGEVTVVQVESEVNYNSKVLFCFVLKVIQSNYHSYRSHGGRGGPPCRHSNS